MNKPLTDQERLIIEKNRKDLEKVREHQKEVIQDLYYEPIREERKKELIEELQKKRKLRPECDLAKINYERLEDKFNKDYEEFY